MGTDKWAYKGIAVESVSTPAGVFDGCLRIQSLNIDGTVVESWYAPGVGLVKKVNEKTGTTELLVSFSKP